MIHDFINVRKKNFLSIIVRDILQARKDSIRQWSKLSLDIFLLCLVFFNLVCLLCLVFLSFAGPDHYVIDKDIVKEVDELFECIFHVDRDT